jgi:poly-gamma-glutamate synthesis protein (capsule biosynthesis protein)
MNYEGDRKDLTLVAVGDALIGRRLSLYDEERFMGLINLIRQADVSFANLETLIHKHEGFAAQYSGGNYMAVPPYIVDELKWAGFNLLARANNHAMDYSHGGMEATSRHLDAAGFVHSGVGENLARARAPGYLEVKKARVALLSICSTCPHGSMAGNQRPDLQGRPGVSGLRFKKRYVVSGETLESLRRVSEEVGLERLKKEMVQRGVRKQESPERLEFLGNEFVVGDKPGVYSEPEQADTQAMADQIKAARRMADFVFVSVHSHEIDHDLEAPTGFLQTFCKACIDAGAHAVIGHGPHVIRGIEIYKGYPIFYSLGNFMYTTTTMGFVPADLYEKTGLDEFRALAADVVDVRSKGDAIRSDPRWWQGVLTQCRFTGGKLAEVGLQPVALGQHSHRAQAGRPLMAEGEEAQQILDRLQRLSEPFGTRLSMEAGRATIAL